MKINLVKFSIKNKLNLSTKLDERKKKKSTSINTLENSLLDISILTQINAGPSKILKRRGSRIGAVGSQ